MFVFDGGALNLSLSVLSLPAAELTEARFVPDSDTEALVSPSLQQRLSNAVVASDLGHTLYIEWPERPSTERGHDS
jgi:hypothetical protein